MVYIVLLWVFILAIFISIPSRGAPDLRSFVDDGDDSHLPKHYTTPMHEVSSSELYLHVNEHGEFQVAYAGRGLDMEPYDYLTHADGVRFMSGGINAFMNSGESRAVLPVVDDDYVKADGFKLIGFVMIEAVQPRKLKLRRGEVYFDLEEGGPPPSLKLGNIVIGKGGVKSTSDPNYVPPPHGGGDCITSRDCYNKNGTCILGQCKCHGPYTGTYCQLDRPEFAAVSQLVKKQQHQKDMLTPKKIKEQNAESVNSFAPSGEAKKHLDEEAEKRLRQQEIQQQERQQQRQDAMISDQEYRKRQAEAARIAEEEAAKQKKEAEEKAALEAAQAAAAAAEEEERRQQLEAQRQKDLEIELAKQKEEEEKAQERLRIQQERDKQAAAAEAAAEEERQRQLEEERIAANEEAERLERDRQQNAMKKKKEPIKLSFGKKNLDDPVIEKEDPPIENQEQQQQPHEVIEEKDIQSNDKLESNAMDGNIESIPTPVKKIIKKKKPMPADGQPLRQDRRFNAQQLQDQQQQQGTGPADLGSGIGLGSVAAENTDATGVSVLDAQKQRVATMSDLYGDGKPYPEPYAAGKLPNHLIHERYRKRFNRESFLYSVRFRTGPLGIAFDNKVNNGTIVETLVKHQQAEQSDIKVGDQLIAVDQYNLTEAPAKVSQRLMSTLPWPRVLVFEARVTTANPKEKEEAVKKRTFNVTIVYPPTLVGEYQFRVAEWASHDMLLTTPTHPHLLSQSDFAPLADDTIEMDDQQARRLQEAKSRFCPIYKITASEDPFGCTPKKNEFSLPVTYQDIMMQGGNVNADLERESQLLTLLENEIKGRKLYIEPRSLAVMKRGVCTFVEKARQAQRSGANLGLVVNTDDELIDMPSGKEKTSDLSIPIGVAREGESILTHLAATTNEIWAVISEVDIAPEPEPEPEPEQQTQDPRRAAQSRRTEQRQQRLAKSLGARGRNDNNNKKKPALPQYISATTDACNRVIALVDELIDRWAHTVPYMPIADIKATKPPDASKVRGLTEEGGRLAVSGQNGWAFFDYHLAMFGPQEVPLGPFRLQMALPPFGCDPGEYTVRIQNTVVAILRGGGCSFGIKVINAQKLGAKAVIIVNTDDMKTMRLMALPDEIPQINIPCIMVSRRIQYYLEEQLPPYFPLDQHIVSIQPTGMFGDYEQKNKLVLPKRLSNS